MMVNAAKYANVDIAVHLDHGLTKRCVAEALSYGFTSVMLDRSLLPFEENVQQTKEIVQMAAATQATVEAELGVVGGNEGDTEEHKITCTDPAMAKEFCERTGIDALAVAIGNAHGNYKETPHLRFDILTKVRESVAVPLVLHGGTGILPEEFKQCFHCGIKKINIATATFDREEQTVREAYAAGTIKGYYDLHCAEIEGAYQNAKKHIEIFETGGHA
jgi:fructose-bisphosphate aldolase class II